jgi:hypothetical protein
LFAPEHDQKLTFEVSQDFAGDHSLGGDALRPVPAVAAECAGPAVRSGVEVSHETVRFSRHRFGPIFASEIPKRRIEGMIYGRRRWYLDEIVVKIGGEWHHLWGRGVDHEGDVQESFVTKARDKKVAPKLLKKGQKRHG